MNTEEQAFNQSLIAALANGDDATIKVAEESGNKIIRRLLRETGFQRGHILPFEPLKESDLTPSLTSELPWKIEEMEALQPGAVTLNYNDTTDIQFYNADKFAMYFHTVSTPRFTKHVLELITYKNDVKEIVTNNALLDLHTQEDTNFLAGVDATVGASNGVGLSGAQQNFTILGRIERTPYAQNLKHLLNAKLTNGVFLINRTTAVDFLTWGREMMGGDLSEKALMEGLNAFEGFTFFKIPHVATLKRELVPDNVVYKFAPKNFLGRAYELQKPTMYMKKENKMLSFYADEVLSLAIPNVASCSKTTHQP